MNSRCSKISPICCGHLDINSKGEEIEEDRPSGANAEHKQSSKTINAPGQQLKRNEKRRSRLSDKYKKAVVERDVIENILEKNMAVELELGSFADATVADFLALKPASKLEDYIHARKFTGKTFERVKVTPPGKKLNKTVYRSQTAQSIEEDCNSDNPCLVWLAHSLRSSSLVLKVPTMPVLSTSLPTPQFTITYATRVLEKCPSEYLLNSAWVESLKATAKGVSVGDVNQSMVAKAKLLMPALQQRLNLHIRERVDVRRQHHWLLEFIWDNLPSMAAVKCVSGHITEHLESYSIDECLLVPPSSIVFQSISKRPANSQLGSLEGSYLHYDQKKMKWIRSGKVSGLGADACFNGRGNTHAKNSRLIEQMRKHTFYQEYPAAGVANIGCVGGHYEYLEVFCGMAFDRSGDVSPICSVDAANSLFVWSDQAMRELKKKDGSIRDNQLVAMSYLWEIVDDLLLDKRHNISVSPGFESLGLRVNN